MSAPKLAQLAAEMLEDMKTLRIGEDVEVDSGEAIDLLQRYRERFEGAVNRALGRPARQEALPLD